MVRARARIGGSVQGVSFRYYTREEARRHRLVGWVRNEEDGSVLLEAEGEKDAVEALLGWCKQGPPSARVSSVDVEWIDRLGTETSFRIRH